MYIDSLDSNKPIRQGDIFRDLFVIEHYSGDFGKPILLSASQDNRSFIEIGLEDASEGQEYISRVTIRKVLGIVITQDCDASRAPFIAFCEIENLLEYDKSFSQIMNSKKSPENKKEAVIERIISETRNNPKWFYLATNTNMGFDEKKAVNFEKIYSIDRKYLLKNIENSQF